MELQAIRGQTRDLVLALSDSVEEVADHCLSKFLITDKPHKEVTNSNPYRRDRARILLAAIRDAIKDDRACFMTFVEILDETLPEATRETVISDLWNKFNRHSGPLRSPVRLRFKGPLLSKRFQKIDRDFYTAIHAGKVEYVNLATKEILLTESSLDIKIMCLLLRAHCEALNRGQMDEALSDCDTAIKAAQRPECENSSLIIGFALTMKTAIFRTEGRFDEATECVRAAKEEYHLAAPSSDTAALIYEDIRLKTAIAESKNTNLYISDIGPDFERLLRHSPSLDECHRSKLGVYLNYKAEVMLRTAYVHESCKTLPPDWIAPTNEDVCEAEAILSSVPLELPEKAYVYKGWHYMAKADLYMVKKQYTEAIEWAEKAREQFTEGGITYVTKPTERIALYTTLHSQELLEENKPEWCCVI